MHIPRQPDAARVVHPGRGIGSDALRVRRQHLVGQLRTVVYWQRLVRARTDLVVAGLLYAAPAPTDRLLAPPATGAVVDDDGDLHDLVSPPEGLDTTRLLGGLGLAGDGPGAHLDRLRQATVTLTARRRSLQDDLDAVTLALHERLAADGADDQGRAYDVAQPVVVASSTVGDPVGT